MGRRTLVALGAGVGVLLAIGAAMYGDDLLADESAGAAGSAATSDPSASPTAPALRMAWHRPEPRTHTPASDAPLDPRCETGRAMCVDKSTKTLRWVVRGKVLLTFDARFGGPRTPTRKGVFRVYDKLRHHESSLYGTQMPFAMFFSGGQAVHYSKEFAIEGYDGASHGCVNIRDRRGIADLFDRVRVGDKVVVYRS